MSDNEMNKGEFGILALLVSAFVFLVLHYILGVI